MGVTTVRHWSAALLAAGKSGETPVAVVRRASLPDQRVLRTQLADVADEVERERLRPPAIFVVGPTAAAAGDWIGSAAGRYRASDVLVTRAARADDPLAQQLEELGAKVLCRTRDRDWSARRLGAAGPGDRAVVAIRVAGLFERQRRGSVFRAPAGHRPRSARAGHGPAGGDRTGHSRCAGPIPPASRSGAGGVSSRIAGRRRWCRRRPAGACLLVRASRGREVLAQRLVAPLAPRSNKSWLIRASTFRQPTKRS